MLFLLTVSFVQRVTRASLENSFHDTGFLCETHIFRPAFMVLLGNGLLALKAEIFIQFLIFSFTDHTEFLGVCHVQPVSLHPPRRYQEQSEGSFIEGGSHTMSKRLPLDTLFFWADRTRQSCRTLSMKSAAPFKYLKTAQRIP